MIDIQRDRDMVKFEVLGLHKLWALTSRLEIPIAHIRGARRDAAVLRSWKGWRLPGTHIPGIITAGTFYHDGMRNFWDVCNPDMAIVVALENESYDQLIIEVADPDAALTLLNATQTTP